MKALRLVAQVLGFLRLLPTISDPTEKVAVVLTVPDSAGMVVSVKDKGKSPSPVRGFLRWGFLNPSLVVQATHKVSVVFASTPVVKEGALTPGSPTAIKGEDFRLNGLTQSQKWLIEVLVRLRRWLRGSRATRYGMGRMATLLTL
jgi:hypothetical protein